MLDFYQKLDPLGCASTSKAWQGSFRQRFVRRILFEHATLHRDSNQERQLTAATVCQSVTLERDAVLLRACC